MEKKTFTVPNISCGHCVHTVQSEVGDIAGVQAVQADEQTKQVTVTWQAPATWEQIASLLTEIDYPPATSNVAIQ
jgi:copper chaperone CopZ